MDPPPEGCELADNRIRELLTQLTFQSFKLVSAQIVVWFNAVRHSVQSVEHIVHTIYTAVTTHDVASQYPELLARICRELVRNMEQDIDESCFLDRLLAKCLHEFSEAKRILDDQGEMWIYQMGSWPQFVSLLKFAGELFKAGLLKEGMFLDHFVIPLRCASILSDLKVEGLCVLTRTAGYHLDDEGGGRGEIDACFKCMHEYAAIHCIPPALSIMLKDLDRLRANGWISLVDSVHDTASVTYPTLASTSKVLPYNFDNMSSSISDATASVSDDTKSDQLYDMPKHEEFYLQDGNVVIVCEGALFRVHTGSLSINSPVFRELLSRRNLATQADRIHGCACIYVPDTKEDFTTLLKLIYYPGFPTRNKTPNFLIFAAILRMTTKYKLDDIREQILVDIQDAYPETFEAYEASNILGEEIFGSPRPHPNAVLNLFRQCGVASALPYAHYLACKGGLSSLTTTTTGAALSAPVLATTVRGLGKLKAAELKVANKILFQQKQYKCSRFLCLTGVSVTSEMLGDEPVFQSIFKSVVDISSEMVTTALETPKFHAAAAKSLFCTKCVEAWLKFHREAREEVWGALPEWFELSP